jgi:hypothetical protein
VNLVLFFSIAVIAGLASPIVATACVCEPWTPCERYSNHDVVFVGRPIDVDLETRFGHRTMVYTFKVQHAIKGVAENEIEVEAGMGRGDCGVTFFSNIRYLVYASRTPYGLGTSSCSGTGSLEWRRDDVRYLNAIRRSPQWGVIYGRVLRYGSELRRGIPRAVVVIEGAGRRRIVAANGYGEFEVGGLREGRYRVRWSAPKGKSPMPREVFVDVRGHDCKEVMFGWETHPGHGS